MYFLKEMTHTVTLAPQYFAQGLSNLLRYALYRQLEGTCHGRFGYIVAIISVDDISQGLIRDSSGALLSTQGSMVLAGTASFEVKFRAVIYRPFKGQVVDIIVRTCNKMGFFGEVGPGVQVFVSAHLMPQKYVFDGSDVPATFVATGKRSELGGGGGGASKKHDTHDGAAAAEEDDTMSPEDVQMPDYFEDDYNTPDEIIGPGAKVRVRIVGTRVDATEIFAIGSIKEEHLGLLPDR